MKDFVLAALPWVAMGVTVAYVLAAFGRKKIVRGKASIKEQEETGLEGDYGAYGISFGMGLGIVASLVFDVIPISYGISFGMLLGMLIGKGIKKKR